MAKIKLDDNNRIYVSRDGQTYRPEASQWDHVCPARNFGRGFTSRIPIGSDVELKHVTPMMMRLRTKGFDDELWVSHSKKPNESPEDSWSPVKSISVIVKESSDDACLLISSAKLSQSVKIAKKMKM